ncbi:unnamed protein product, partial [Prorocentrum cordatum]
TPSARLDLSGRRKRREGRGAASREDEEGACHSRCSTDGWHYGKQECLSAVLARAIAEALGKRSGLARSVWPAEYGHKTRDLPRREAPLPSGGSRQVERLVGAAEGSRASVEVTPPDLQVAGLGPLAAESPVEVLAVADDGHPLLGPLRQPRQEPPEAAPVGPVHEVQSGGFSSTRSSLSTTGGPRPWPKSSRQVRAARCRELCTTSSMPSRLRKSAPPGRSRARRTCSTPDRKDYHACSDADVFCVPSAGRFRPPGAPQPKWHCTEASDERSLARICAPVPPQHRTAARPGRTGAAWRRRRGPGPVAGTARQAARGRRRRRTRTFSLDSACLIRYTNLAPCCGQCWALG